MCYLGLIIFQLSTIEHLISSKKNTILIYVFTGDYAQILGRFRILKVFSIRNNTEQHNSFVKE